MTKHSIEGRAGSGGGGRSRWKMCKTAWARRALLASALTGLMTVPASLAAGSSPACAQQAPAVLPADGVLSAGEAHARAKAGQIVLIDIRAPDEWRETGVPASAYAVTMHQRQDAFERLLVAATGGSKAKPVALICATGSRSRRLAAWMRSAGYQAVLDVGEGVEGGPRGAGWLKAGLPVRKWAPGRDLPE